MKSVLSIAFVVATLAAAQAQAVKTVANLLQEGYEIVGMTGTPSTTRIMLRKGATLYICEITENPARTRDCSALDK
jgi:hypothetical protein